MRFAVSDRRGINMIPILYEKTETEFTSNGIGLLSDCIYCNVTEERNGLYECEFQYPQTGIHFEDITEGRIIACTHDEAGDVQAFDIYKSSKVIDGIVTFYARHISYRQNEIAVKPFTSQSCAGAIQALKTNSINTNPFSYWTDKAVDGEYKVSQIRALRGLLGGEQGSLLDRYGTGEYEWDNFTTKLHLHRGKDTDVEIRYGKNLIDLTDDSDFSDTYNGVAPFWIGTQMGEDDGEQEEVFVKLTEWAIYSENTTYGSRDIVIPLDLSGSFQEPPTEQELRTKAQSYLADSIAPNRNLKVDFVQLWQTEEYALYAPLERCKLCDTVTVVHPALNISTRQKIIKVVWDVLMDRYAEMELGDTKSTYSSLVREIVDPDLQEIEQQLKAVTQVADNTNQYFWHTEVESSIGANDTGAHITEITREEFMDDPANGGPNLLMRSNGIALRDGVTELARFKANGIQIGQDTEANVELLSDSLTFYGDDLEKVLEASADGVTTYISGVAAASFKTTGIEFNDELPMTIGNTTTFIKWIKENNTWKLKIQADEVEIGGVPALTTQDQLTITNIEYAYQLSSSGTTVPTGTWSSTPVAPTTTQYAWTRTTVTYSDGHQTISYTIGGKAGVNGQNGHDGASVSIIGTSVKYQSSSSGTTVPTGTWQSSIPSVSAGDYLWTRTIVNYSDGETTTSYSVARQGENGQDITSQYMWFRASEPYQGLNIKYTNYNNRININADGITLYDGNSDAVAQFGEGIKLGYGGGEYLHINAEGALVEVPIFWGEYYSDSPTTTATNTKKVALDLSTTRPFNARWNELASGGIIHVRAKATISYLNNGVRTTIEHTIPADFKKGESDYWNWTNTTYGTLQLQIFGNELAILLASNSSTTYLAAGDIVVYGYEDRPAPSFLLGTGVEAYGNALAIGKYNSPNEDYALMVGNGTSGVYRSNALEVDWNGNTIIAGTLTQGSDCRLKEHVDFIGEEAEVFIRELKPAHYIKDGKNHVGFYAQDVAEVDPWNCMTGEMNGYMTLGYSEIIAPLVTYCQRLEQRIKRLEA